MTSPIGELTIVAGVEGMRAVLVGDESRVVADLVRDTDDPTVQRLLTRAVDELTEYFAGERRDFDLPLDPRGTEFQQRAWQQLRRIPYGETINYGEQARRLGAAKASRAVGSANGRNPIAVVVPCHRVVGADGSLTGYASGVDRKAWLLDHERRVLRS